MTLNATDAAKKLDEELDKFFSDPSIDFAEAFAKAYNDYAKEGVVPGATTGSEDWTIIRDGIRSMRDYARSGNSATAILTLATAFASYWNTALIEPGTPSHGGSSVQNVVNDAMTRVDSFVAAITAAYNDASAPEELPYEILVERIETIAVLTIIWTVTEIVDGSPATFAETIT